MITNPTASYIQLAGSIMSHLKVSTPDATYAVGLQGSNYCSKQPISSKFRIVPPESRKEKSFSAFFRSWAHKGLDGLFSGWHQKNQEEEREEEDKEKEESNDYAQMNNEISRIYTFTPMEFTMIDRVTILSSMKATSQFTLYE
ncbi:hypothetical protein AXF42_Ash005054 [Apostasia shenzhenica]|uniref:Uncharacterized protein n=1 Tax=Apostasia shenzhenica TaxID=1088818 RepID=A0A2I0B8B6_9ASPA|nr:hypothetical protein AXF42_Ash005054 [Apostasia shenzhenica]